MRLFSLHIIMRKRGIFTAALIVQCLLLITVPLKAQDYSDWSADSDTVSKEKPESTVKEVKKEPKEKKEEKAPEESGEEYTFPPEFIVQGFVESENYISSKKDQDLKDAWVKNEVRNRLRMKYGTETLYVDSVTNIYIMPTFLDDAVGSRYFYSTEGEFSRNGRLSNRASEVQCTELYFNYSGSGFRFRGGNQIYGWGTADAINPTSYINPQDFREVFLRDSDEGRFGVPSFSGLLFLSDYTLELVFVPVHIPMVMPSKDSYWSPAPEDYPFEMTFGQGNAKEIAGKNMAYSARLSGTMKGMDMSISGYYGPDRDPVYLPYGTVIEPNRPVSLLIQPNYFNVAKTGFDFSTTFDRFVVQAEASYSPNKGGYISQSMDDVRDLTLPYETDRSHYISYSAGFNYFVPLTKLIEGHNGESVFTFEWHQSRYFNRDLASPLISELISCRYEDSFIRGKLQMKMTGVIEPLKKSYILWPKLGWDFQNGLSVEISYMNISGANMGDFQDNSIMYYLSDKDIAIWKVKYVY